MSPVTGPITTPRDYPGAAVRRLTALTTLLVLLAAAPAALGQTDVPPGDPIVEEPAPPPAPEPKNGKMKLTVLSGIAHKGKRHVTKGQRTKVRGRARPYVEGQHVQVEVRRKGRRVISKRMRLRKVRGRNAGQFVIRFKARAKGFYRVRAHHRATPEQKEFSARKRVRAVDNTARAGSRGIRVRLLQRGLKRLGYAGLSANGRYGPGTGRAVLAFRKVNRMPRNTYAGRQVFKKVFQRRGTFRLKYPNAGKHVEADLSRQVLVLARNGRAQRIYHTSSGKPSTPTILGSFRFYRKEPGTNNVGMVHSSYFIRGYAIHGYKSVPTYPASAGCLRVPIPNAWSIYSWIDNGDRIFVYR